MCRSSCLASCPIGSCKDRRDRWRVGGLVRRQSHLRRRVARPGSPLNEPSGLIDRMPIERHPAMTCCSAGCPTSRVPGHARCSRPIPSAHCRIDIAAVRSDEGSAAHSWPSTGRATSPMPNHMNAPPEAWRPMSSAGRSPSCPTRSVQSLLTTASTSPCPAIRVPRWPTSSSPSSGDLFRAHAFEAHAFELACARSDIEHRLAKPNHAWTSARVERMNRTIKEATIWRNHYDSHQQLRDRRTTFSSLRLRQTPQVPERPHALRIHLQGLGAAAAAV